MKYHTDMHPPGLAQILGRHLVVPADGAPMVWNGTQRSDYACGSQRGLGLPAVALGFT